MATQFSTPPDGRGVMWYEVRQGSHADGGRNWGMRLTKATLGYALAHRSVDPPAMFPTIAEAERAIGIWARGRTRTNFVEVSIVRMVETGVNEDEKDEL